RELEEIEAEFDDLHEDNAFWAELAHSLAVFAGPDGLRSFRLPNHLGEEAHVADRFYVKPLLRAVTFPQTAFVLALAEGSVRLLAVTPDLPTFAVKVPDLPKSAAGYGHPRNRARRRDDGGDHRARGEGNRGGERERQDAGRLHPRPLAAGVELGAVGEGLRGGGLRAGLPGGGGRSRGGRGGAARSAGHSRQGGRPGRRPFRHRDRGARTQAGPGRPLLRWSARPDPRRPRPRGGHGGGRPGPLPRRPAAAPRGAPHHPPGPLQPR